MTTFLERRSRSNFWDRFCNWITSTENRHMWVGLACCQSQHSACLDQQVIGGDHLRWLRMALGQRQFQSGW